MQSLSVLHIQCVATEALQVQSVVTPRILCRVVRVRNPTCWKMYRLVVAVILCDRPKKVLVKRWDGHEVAEVLFFIVVTGQSRTGVTERFCSKF